MNFREGIRRLFVIAALLFGVPLGALLGYVYTEVAIERVYRVELNAERDLLNQELLERFRKIKKKLAQGDKPSGESGGELAEASQERLEGEKSSGPSLAELKARARKNLERDAASLPPKWLRRAAVVLGVALGAVLGYFVVVGAGRAVGWVVAGFQSGR